MKSKKDKDEKPLLKLSEKRVDKKQTNFEYYFSSPERAALFVSDLVQIAVVFGNKEDNNYKMWEMMCDILNFNPGGFFSAPIFEWLNEEKGSEPKYIYSKYGRFDVGTKVKDDEQPDV